jgi:hypothetical protein
MVIIDHNFSLELAYRVENCSYPTVRWRIRAQRKEADTAVNQPAIVTRLRSEVRDLTANCAEPARQLHRC